MDAGQDQNVSPDVVRTNSVECVCVCVCVCVSEKDER